MDKNVDIASDRYKILFEIDYLTNNLKDINGQISTCKQKLRRSLKIIKDEEACMIKLSEDKIKFVNLLKDINIYLKQNHKVIKKNKIKGEYLYKVREKLYKERYSTENWFNAYNKELAMRIRNAKQVLKELNKVKKEKEKTILEQAEELKDANEVEVELEYYDNAASIIQRAWKCYKDHLYAEGYFSNLKGKKVAFKGILEQFLNIKTWKNNRKSLKNS